MNIGDIVVFNRPYSIICTEEVTTAITVKGITQGTFARVTGTRKIHGEKTYDLLLLRDKETVEGVYGEVLNRL